MLHQGLNTVTVFLTFQNGENLTHGTIQQMLHDDRHHCHSALSQFCDMPTSNLLYAPSVIAGHPHLISPHSHCTAHVPHRLSPYSKSKSYSHLSNLQPNYGSRWQSKVGSLANLNERTVPSFQVRLIYKSFPYSPILCLCFYFFHLLSSSSSSSSCYCTSALAIVFIFKIIILYFCLFFLLIFVFSFLCLPILLSSVVFHIYLFIYLFIHLFIYSFIHLIYLLSAPALLFSSSYLLMSF